MNKLKTLLGFDPATTTVRTELLAGMTTFMTMSYILAVNPTVLSTTGMDKGALSARLFLMVSYASWFSVVGSIA